MVIDQVHIMDNGDGDTVVTINGKELRAVVSYNVERMVGEHQRLTVTIVCHASIDSNKAAGRSATVEPG